MDAAAVPHAISRHAGPMVKRDRDRQAADDARIVRAVLAGDRDAYGELYDRYVRLIHAVCHDATGDLHRAHDLAHEVLLRAYQRLRQLRRPEAFGPWLLKIARHAAHDSRRRRSRDPHVYVGLEPEGEPRHTPAPDDRLAALQCAVGRLPEQERLAVHLAYLEQQPAEHARRLLGLSRSGFYRVLGRARTRLQRILEHDQETIQ